MLHFGLRTRPARSGARRWPTTATTRRSSRIRYAVRLRARVPAVQERIGLRRCRYAVVRRGADRPRGARVLHRPRRAGVRALRHDRELGASPPPTSSGRMKLGTVGEPYPGIGFRIDEETGEIQTKHDGSVRRLLEQAGQDGRDVHRRRLADDRRRRRVGRRHAHARSSTASSTSSSRRAARTSRRPRSRTASRRRRTSRRRWSSATGASTSPR